MAEENLAPVGTLGVEAIAARALYEANLAGELLYFAPVATLPGFAKALARTLQELRLAGVRAEELAKTGEPGADLGKLLVRYQNELTVSKLADLAGILELARKAVESGGGDAPLGKPFVGLPMIALDVPLETAAHRAFFGAVAEKSPTVIAVVSSGGANKQTTSRWDSVRIFEGILGVPAEDLDDPNERGSLARLRRGLFSTEPLLAEAGDAEKGGSFELFSSPGEGLEAVEIARRILKLAREGVPFDSMAVLLRSVERYQPLIEEALRRARIPAYFSRGTLRPDTAGRAFLALLECASEKCSATRFAEYLSLAQVPAEGLPEDDWVAPQDEVLGALDGGEPRTDEDADPAPSPRSPARWERLLVDAAVIGGSDRWERRLKGLEHEFELRIAAAEREDDNQRKGLERQLEELQELEKFALPVIGHLAALPASATWGEWLESLASLARRTLRRPEAVLSVLAELEPMAAVGPVKLDEVSEVLRERLRFLRAEPPPRRYGRVFVGSIEEARGCAFETVFLPGLAEGLFPQKSFEDPLLLDEFRRSITALLPTRDDRVEQERLKLRLALGAARERLVASYPRMDTAEGRPRVPSFYALELPRAKDGRLPQLKQFEEEARAGAPARINWPAPVDAADAIDDAEYDLAVLGRSEKAAHYLLDVNATLARSLRARWKRWNQKWWDADGLITIDPGALEALAAHRLTARPWSPSSLQKFAECPYQFALHGIFGLRPRDDGEALEQLDPLTRGGLFHAVQFALLGDLKRSSLLPVRPENLADALKHLDAALGRVAGEYREKLAPAIERVWQTGVEDLRTDLRGWLQFVAANDAGWEPLHFEFAFGLPPSAERDPASTAAEAILEEGVHLRGSIDLVEREAASGALRVTDHKTGKRPDTIPLYVGGGKLLQPMLYGLAAQKILGHDVGTGRLFYATQRGAYDVVNIQIHEKSRMILARLLANIDTSIANGFLPPAPQRDACDRCDYRSVCGPYEEQRYEETKNRRDERLEALIEIRGMA
jgi:CRISPR/Cas system-associated exonuclease Cas4 (RecB family)